MESRSDLELIEKIKNDNCSESLTELSNRHGGLFNRVVEKYSCNTNLCSGVTKKDFYDDKLLVLYDSILNYDNSKGVQFNTYFGNNVRYHCLNKINKEKKYYPVDSKDLNYYIEKAKNRSGVEFDIYAESEYILELIKKMKDKRLYRIFKMRYFNKHKKRRSFSYIASRLGISIQGAINLHNKTLEFIKQKIKSKECVEII